MPIRDLLTHPFPYVSVGELASYWRVGRKQIYKQIDAGTLEAIRLGPRLFRIRTSVARDFEERARMRPEDHEAASPHRFSAR
jgi:excisionase family DNA binding protein